MSRKRNGLEYLLEDVEPEEPSPSTAAPASSRPPTPVAPRNGSAPAASTAPVPRHLRRSGLQENREHSRRDLVFDVSFERGDEHVPARGYDLSRRGMFVATRRALRPGDLVSAKLRIEHREIKVIAEVVWTRNEDPAALDLQPGMGLKFLDVEDDDADFIDALVAS